MLTIWSLCLLHKSGPVMCNVCLSCPYSAFSMEGVWVTLRKSLTRSPTSGSEGVKKNLCVTGPRKFMRFSQSSSGLCEAILVDVHLSTSWLTEICQPAVQCFWLGKLGPRFWSAFLKTAGPENSLVFHLAVKHWTTFIISRVYICVMSFWVAVWHIRSTVHRSYWELT